MMAALPNMHMVVAMAAAEAGLHMSVTVMTVMAMHVFVAVSAVMTMSVTVMSVSGLCRSGAKSKGSNSSHNGQPFYGGFNQFHGHS